MHAIPNQARQILLALVAGIACCVLGPLGLTRAAESTPEAASYRILMADGSGGSSTGIANHLVVTNAHVAGQLNLQATIINDVTGERHTGRTLALDAARDVALVEISSEVCWVKVNPDGIDQDKPLRKLSYGGGVRGQLVSVDCRLRSREEATFTVTTPSVSGDSGGGVFQNGVLVGVLWGTSSFSDPNGYTIGAESIWIQRLITEVDRKYNTGLHQTVFG